MELFISLVEDFEWEWKFAHERCKKNWMVIILIFLQYRPWVKTQGWILKNQKKNWKSNINYNKEPSRLDETWRDLVLLKLPCKTIRFSSSSSCRTISTDLPDPLLPPFPIIHCFWLVLRAASHIGTELLYVASSRSSCLCMSIWRGLHEYITYELVPTSPAVSCISGSSNFDSFRDGWLVAVQLLLCGVLSLGLVQYCWQHSCVVAIKLFLHTFS